MPSIIHHRGQVNEAVDPRNGKTIKREDNLFIVANEALLAVKAVPDQDHFLWQSQMPIPNETVVTKYGGILPESMRGPHVSCTCGSDAVYMLEGEYAGMMICRSYLTTGFHQTSHTIKNGVMELNKQSIKERTADPDEIVKQRIVYRPKL